LDLVVDATTVEEPITAPFDETAVTVNAGTRLPSASVALITTNGVVSKPA